MRAHGRAEGKATVEVRRRAISGRTGFAFDDDVRADEGFAGFRIDDNALHFAPVLRLGGKHGGNEDEQE